MNVLLPITIYIVSENSGVEVSLSARKAAYRKMSKCISCTRKSGVGGDALVKLSVIQ
jgi:hypothetical protein